MVKKFVAILLASFLVLGVSCCVALAVEVPEKIEAIEIEEPDWELLRIIHTPHYPTQNVYVPVTIIQEQADGSTVTSTIYPAVVRVQYKYYTTQSEVTGTYTGGYVVLSGSYPNLTVIAADYLDVSAAKVSYPTVGDVSYSDDQYTVSIRGGSFTITYNATVRYNAQGQIVSTTPTTVTRVYNYSETGP